MLLRKKYISDLLFALVVTTWVGSVARADDNEIPTVGEVLKRAGDGRDAMIEVTDELKRLLPSLPGRDELFPYLLMLPKFEKIAAKYDFATTGSDPVKSLSFVVTRNAAKWIEIDTIDWAVTEEFFRRADNAARQGVASQQYTRLTLETEKEGLIKWHELAMRLQDFNRAMGSDASVLEKCEDLQALTTKRLLKIHAELKPEVLDKALSQTKASSALQEVLGYLTQEVAKQTEADQLERYVGWVLLLSPNVIARGDNVPAHVRQGPGRLLLEIERKLLGQDRTIAAKALDAFVAALEPSQVAELSELLTSRYESIPIPVQLTEELWEISLRVSKALLKQGDTDRAKRQERLHQRLATARLQQVGSFEGTYRLSLDPPHEKKERETGIATVAAIGSSSFILGLNILYRSDGDCGGYGQDYNFFDIIYDSKAQEYRAQYRAVDSPKYLFRHEHVHQLRFNFHKQPNGRFRLTGKFLDGTRPLGYRTFTGEQLSQYPVFSPRNPATVENIEGRYSAFVEGREHELRIVKTGSVVGGIYFWIPDDRTGVSFEWGIFQPRSDSLLLTAGELRSRAKWFHLRGVFSKDGQSIEVTFIKSGEGIQHRVRLNRVKE